MKRLFSVLMIMILCFTLLPFAAFAEAEPTEEMTGTVTGDLALVPVAESEEEPPEEEETVTEPVAEPTEEEPATDGAVYSGTCGSNVNWSLDTATGTMIITGTGSMTDYTYTNYKTSVPWSSYRASIKTVSVGSGVTSIGAYAFRECESLTTLTLPDTVVTIGDDAFDDCTHLTNVALGSGLLRIGTEAFYDCSALHSLTFRSAITYIGVDAFYDCPCLTNYGNCGATGTGKAVKWYLFGSGQLLLTGNTDGIMQDYTLDSFAPWYSSRSSIKSVIIGSGVSSIGKNAFYDHKNMTGLTLPASVTSIGNTAFDGCSGLSDVYFGGTLKQWYDAGVGSGSSTLKYVKCVHCAVSGGASPLTFTAQQAGSSVTFSYKNGSCFRYSTDGGATWKSCGKGVEIQLENVGDTVCFSGLNIETDSIYGSDKRHFSMTGKIAASGDVTSLTNGIGGDVALSQNCYEYMFCDCTALTSAPSLPSMTLEYHCYYKMFLRCSGLTAAPALPATTLAKECYACMFEQCLSLTTAPALPATSLALGCYMSMFHTCASLTSVPVLPAVTLKTECYSGMFYGCSKLTAVPALPATTLAEKCYYKMFKGCSGIRLYNTDTGGKVWSIPAGAAAMTDWNTEMFAGIGGDADDSPVIGKAYYAANPLTFTAQMANSTVTLKCKSATYIQYSTDGGSTWTDGNTAGVTVTLAKVGDKVSFRGQDVKTDKYHHFSMTGKLAASGDVTSLTNGVGGDAALTTFCYNRMFNGCAALTAAPRLPSTTLEYGCYSYMFYDCTGLTKAPTISATTLADSCCEYMFENCTALTAAPALLATTMEPECYTYMFWGCTALTDAPALPAMTLAKSCYEDMFGQCDSLVSAPALPAIKMESHCYDSMFFSCDSLVAAPDLPAMTLADWCYYQMFSYCKKLAAAPSLPATTLAESCYNGMFLECSKLLVAPFLPATTLATHCYYGMFRATGIKLYKTDAGGGKTWSIPAGANVTGATDWNTEMFCNTDGDIDDAPTVGTTYYYAAVSKTLSGIAVTAPPMKTVYTAGESFDPAGMVVTATYSDGSKSVVAATVTDGAALSVDRAYVTVSYTEGGVTVSVSQAVTVNAAAGDVNGDGYCTALDLVVLAQYLAGDGTADAKYPDANGSGTEDLLDLVFVMRVLAK